MTWALRTDLTLEELNLHLPALQAAGLLGIAEEGGRATAYLPERVAELPVPGRWAPVPERDWSLEWRRHLRPVTVEAAGRRIVVCPPWDVPDDGPQTLVLVIEPGQAFGTGHHETTAGCLAALCELDLGGAAVLDVGTGSGVLAIAAAHLGAGRVVAVDTDPTAIAAAAANAERNATAIDPRAGSLAEARDAAPFTVIVANLDTDTLCGLAGELAGLLAVDGRLVASGVSQARSSAAHAALAAAGLTVHERPGAEWVVLLASR